LSQNIFIILVASQGIVGLAAFCALFFVSAPYGKHSRPGWGPRLSSKLAWIVMETPAVLVPPGMLLALVSNPNYLGEIIQWIGFALLTRSVAAWAFALFTFCNIFPRAVQNHRWYHEHFSDYPEKRKVIIPYIF